jgi:hypothetical protein
MKKSIFTPVSFLMIACVWPLLTEYLGRTIATLQRRNMGGS